VGQGIGPATLVRRRPDALWRDTPSGVLVLGEGDDVICIEGAGRLLWLVLERPATMAELHRFFSDTDLSTGLDGGVQGLVELGLVDLS
jgi:hypothetical protein